MFHYCSSPIGKKTRIYRLVSTSDQRNIQLRKKLEEARKKRSRLIELIHQISSFRDYNKLQGVDDGSIASALTSLENKVCTEVEVESKELADICDELHVEVKDKRKDVIDLLAKILVVSTEEDPHS